MVFWTRLSPFGKGLRLRGVAGRLWAWPQRCPTQSSRLSGLLDFHLFKDQLQRQLRAAF